MIFVDLKNRKNYKKHWIDQVKKNLIGYEISNRENCKLIICDSTTYNLYKDSDKKIIVVSMTDGIVLNRHWIRDNVKYVICHSELNGSILEMNPLTYILSKNYGTPFKGEYISIEDMKIIKRKMMCYINTSEYHIGKFQENVMDISNRKIDVSMISTLVYDEKVNTNPNRHLVSRHRICLKEELEKICKKNNLRLFSTTDRISFDDYQKILMNTKLHICPYGTGEFTHKEYESICFGSHVMKPDVYFNQDLDLYRMFGQFNSDLSDLEDKIIHYLNIDIQSNVDFCRNLMKNHDLSNNLIKIKKLIDECLL